MHIFRAKCSLILVYGTSLKIYARLKKIYDTTFQIYDTTFETYARVKPDMHAIQPICTLPIFHFIHPSKKQSCFSLLF